MSVQGSGVSEVEIVKPGMCELDGVGMGRKSMRTYERIQVGRGSLAGVSKVILASVDRSILKESRNGESESSPPFP
jgi:hypothetical protein